MGNEDVQYIYTREYYSAIKRNKRSFAVMWMNLESVIQSELKLEGEKRVSYIKAYIWNLGTVLIAQLVKNLLAMQGTPV